MEAAGADGYRCSLCDVTCTGTDAFNAHLKGAKHLKVGYKLFSGIINYWCPLRINLDTKLSLTGYYKNCFEICTVFAY